MKNQITKLLMLAWCAAAVLVAPALTRAQDITNAPAAAKAPAAKKHTATSSATLPFRGTVTAMDTNAMTLAVEKRTFNMTFETIVTKDGKPAVLADGVVGEPVRGAYKKNADGKLDAVTIRFGGAGGAAKKGPN